MPSVWFRWTIKATLPMSMFHSTVSLISPPLSAGALFSPDTTYVVGGAFRDNNNKKLYLSGIINLSLLVRGLTWSTVHAPPPPSPWSARFLKCCLECAEHVTNVTTCSQRIRWDEPELQPLRVRTSFASTVDAKMRLKIWFKSPKNQLKLITMTKIDNESAS